MVLNCSKQLDFIVTKDSDFQRIGSYGVSDKALITLRILSDFKNVSSYFS